MTKLSHEKSRPLLFVLAGAKGAVGSTVAAAIAAVRKDSRAISSCLTTADLFPEVGLSQDTQMAGWDSSPRSLLEGLEHHGVLEEKIWKPYGEILQGFTIRRAPDKHEPLAAQVEGLRQDLRDFKKAYPDSLPVLINLLPACEPVHFPPWQSLEELTAWREPVQSPDLAYTLAAVLAGLPIVNFTSNEVEIPAVVKEAEKRGIPLCGRDGKTGQTYLKVLLASALKARCLQVEGWYSLNILGNQDGENLADPCRARGKLANKTEVLDGILGYSVGRPEAPCHKVRIDYYPPRGDAKEAWDVIDFRGLFGLPMSLRLNLMARDSVLAAPLVLDLARWMIALQKAGRSGLVPELGFFFKKPLGPNPPLTFQDQLTRLRELEISLGTDA
jgi:myo-inositol-1-phosphate synthase